MRMTIGSMVIANIANEKDAGRINSRRLFRSFLYRWIWDTKRAPRGVQHTNRGLVEQGAYATKQLRQRRTYEFYPWNPAAATPEPIKPSPARPRDRLKLARHYQALMDSEKFANRAALARFLGVSRARVTQVLNRLKSIDDESNGTSDVA
jgi:hypothetical protein